MHILEVYKKYQLPPNLVRHQLEVTAVGRYVADNWTGNKVDKELITKVLLLHDMANIIKFHRPFMDELEANAEHWEKVQEKFKAKYGSDVHTATLAIIDELGLSRIHELVDQMHDTWAHPERQVSVEAQICEFADCCVVPKGIVTFEKRLADLKTRYAYTDASAPLKAARANAELIAGHVSVDLDRIETHDFSQDTEFLKSFNL